MDANSRRHFLKTSAAGLVWLSSAGRAAQADQMSGWTLRTAAEKVRQKAVSPVELTQSCLRRIEQLNPMLNAFITVTGEAALAQARELEAEQQKGKWRGPLHGVPLALKDNIDTAGVRTTGASAVFADRVPAEDAVVAAKLKAAGAIVLGKLNLHEFAAGGTTVTTYYGPVRNPWNRDRITGGSSGGSAAAVAATLCYGALGTDTGGSIRQPAAYCGIAGLKPTYGRVSNRGVIPLSWTLDHVGPMCHTVADAAVMLQVLAGYDARDTSSADQPVPDYLAALESTVSSLRIGVPRAMFYDKLDPAIAAALEAALKVVGKMTAGMRDVTLPGLAQVPPLVEPEMYVYHAPYFDRTPELYQSPVRKRIERGKSVPVSVYIQTRREVDQARRDVAAVFSTVDLLVTPTTRIMPYTIEEARKRDLGQIPPEPELSNTRPFNIFGLPTISVPCGFSQDGMPIGLQISGPAWGEGKVLALAQAFERATEWHQRRPLLNA
jgi:aspartyl-tRNA(Asn)/glutamyl-tRNA(Gln) amidotransferase subunit A